MAMNKGEWSEIYTFLKILDNPSLDVYCSQLLNKIDRYTAKEIYKTSQLGHNVTFFLDNGSVIFNSNQLDKVFIKNTLNDTFQGIVQGVGRSFNILSAENFANHLNIELKAPSNEKGDINMKVEDGLQRISPKLGYSIKSKLGQSATLLNASALTNFEYIVDGLNAENIREINSINTRTKLKDRYKKIIELGGRISFNRALGDVFKENLKLLDGDLEELLGELLLNSYSNGTKDLSRLLEISTEANNFDVMNPTIFYNQKYNKFLEAITFGMRPSSPYDPEILNSMGGIIIVLNNGNIALLDKIYYSNHVKKYLFNNLKLDSPSSSRWDMLNLKIGKDTKIKFTLNLQVRFK